jgi:membrane protein
VVRHVFAETVDDSFIHAGNLAYLSMLAIFPFFILGAALFDMIGGRDNATAMILAVAAALPDSVAAVIVPVAESVVYARSGWLFWLGRGSACGPHQA